MTTSQPKSTDESVAKSLSTFIATVADGLEAASAGDDLVETVQEQGDDLVDEIADLEDENEHLRERVDDLEDDSSEIRDVAARERAQLRKRLFEAEQEIETLQDRLDASNPTPDGEKPASKSPNQAKSPLEQVVALGDDMTDQLTANQRRARFVASDVPDYAKSVPAGWAIASSDLRRVLSAAFDAGHSQTVDRVMTMLDDLGGDDVRIVERHGTRRVVFSSELVDRIQSLDQTDHSVVGEVEA